MSMINSLFFVGYIAEILSFLSVAAIFCGVYTIISKNPIVSVLYLICLFLVIACYLISTGTTFIGLAYLLIYVGAVSILFLFIVMLINVRVSELLIENFNSIPLAVLLGIFFFYFVYNASQDSQASHSNNNHNFNGNQKNFISMIQNIFKERVAVFFVASFDWERYLAEIFHAGGLGNVLYGIFSIWLIIISFILLLGMVGSIVITIKSPHSRSIISSFSLIGIDGDISWWAPLELSYKDYHNVTNMDLTSDIITCYPIIIGFIVILLSIVLLRLWLLLKDRYIHLIYLNVHKLQRFTVYFCLLPFIYSFVILGWNFFLFSWEWWILENTIDCSTSDRPDRPDRRFLALLLWDMLYGDLIIPRGDRTPRELYRIGNCEHGDWQYAHMRSTDTSPCDFNPSPEHRAIVDEHNDAFLCRRCHAIICKGCFGSNAAPEPNYSGDNTDHSNYSNNSNGSNNSNNRNNRN
jgi:NADH-ubiquinone oxidoreductase chain 6